MRLPNWLGASSGIVLLPGMNSVLSSNVLTWYSRNCGSRFACCKSLSHDAWIS